MNNAELAVLFDMVKHHVNLVNFTGAEQPPAYDLYSARPSAVHRAAMAVLEAHGLARPEVWAGATFHRLDDAARAALTD